MASPTAAALRRCRRGVVLSRSRSASHQPSRLRNRPTSSWSDRDQALVAGHRGSGRRAVRSRPGIWLGGRPDPPLAELPLVPHLHGHRRAGCQTQPTGVYVSGGAVPSAVAHFVVGSSTTFGCMLRDDSEGSSPTRTTIFSSKELGAVAQEPQLVVTDVTVP